MYSVVLLTAMTATAEAPGFGSFWSKHCFWDSCYPARYGWTCGPGWGGYYPAPISSCHGCWSSCHGCWSSCHGCWSSCHGCWSSCHGCWSSCHGCWSSCHGYTCYGCYGGGLPHGIGYAGFGGFGNFGMYGAFPVPPPSYGLPFDPRATDAKPADPRPVEIKPIEIPAPEKKALSVPSETKAAVVVKVPAGAKVYIDNNLMKSTAAERVFTSPALEPGESYFYMVRVVAEKDGREVEEVRRVSVRAGERSELAFDTIFDKLDRPDDRAIVEAIKRPTK